MLTISQIVDKVEYLIYLQRQRPAKRGTEASAKLEARIADVTATLPPMEETPWPWGINHVALGRADRNALLKRMEDNDKQIATALKDAEKDAWKWSGRKEGPKEPAIVAELRAANVELEKQIEAIEENLKPIELILADEERAIAEQAAMDDWAADGYWRTPPAHVTAYSRAFYDELLVGCKRLRLPKHRSCIVVV